MVRGLQIYRRGELKRMTITWNTGLAAERARHNLKLKNKKRPPARKLQAASSKLQASSATKKTQS